MNPHVINNIDFAKKNLVLTGQLGATDCLRLVAFLEAKDANTLHIQYQLKGVAHDMSHPQLELKIEANLPLECQRCLKPMQQAMTLRFQYAISDDAEEQDANADDMDYIEPDRAMNLIDLIEDELIAALPIAPKHETPCGEAHLLGSQKESPFAALKSLKKN